MKFEKLITTIDAQVEGMPIRLITGGVPLIPGRSMAEKRDFLRKNCDYLRTSLVFEPRGHNNMFAAILTTPVTDGAAFGILFLSPWGYINMCGHGSMGIATIAVETGLVESRKPITRILIDTPAGPVEAKVHVRNGKPKSVSVQNVPSFYYGTESIHVPGIGGVSIDIAYGGNNFGIVKAKDLGINCDVTNIVNIQPLLTHIKKTLEAQVKIQHPEIADVKGIEGIIISDIPTNPRANVKNIAIGPGGNIDRSPCGTGTSARLATEYFKGNISLGEAFVTESIIGSIFYATAIREVFVGNLKAIVPEITGSGHITGLHHFIIDAEDPFKYGFQL